MKNNKVLFLVQFSVLTAILAIFCFYPMLGSIPIKPVEATTAMIPVILTALLLGTKAGTVMGGIAGLFSFIVWSFMTPNPAIAFLFSPLHSIGGMSSILGSLFICFVPRILVGTVTGLVHNALSKMMPKRDVLGMVIASVAGSLTNTVGFLLGTWVFFGMSASSPFATTILTFAGTVVLTGGIPEAILSGVVCPAVSKPMKIISKRR